MNGELLGNDPQYEAKFMNNSYFWFSGKPVCFVATDISAKHM